MKIDREQIKAQITRAVACTNDPWYVAKIVQADGAIYAKVLAQDASESGVFRWNGKSGEKSRLRFCHWAEFPKNSTTLWETRGY